MDNPYWLQREMDLQNLAGRGTSSFSPTAHPSLSLFGFRGLKSEFVTRLCHCLSLEALATVNLDKSPVLSDVQNSFQTEWRNQFYSLNIIKLTQFLLWNNEFKITAVTAHGLNCKVLTLLLLFFHYWKPAQF